MMIGYEIYDRFTMEYFPLRQSMILTCFFAATVFNSFLCKLGSLWTTHAKKSPIYTQTH
jgi:hypothetical protein